ncbi:MAG: glycosyltransferase family 1 protein [Flavipsychrobacter sp.]|jgi:glycosyltransferase involved in cell wall biosynthesis|nr:glycosyltransferase family 1 protein [Flavipsychrobacter sp.]
MTSKTSYSMPADMITGRDFVIVGQQPWDEGIGSNCRNIALEFSKHNRVLYVNSALNRITLLREKTEPRVQRRLAVINGKEKGLVSIQPDLWNLYPSCITESINQVKVRPLYNVLNKRNNRLYAQSIHKATDELGFKNIILFNDNDIFGSFYLKELLRPAVSIYYSRDYMIADGYWKYHGEVLEPQLIAKSDLCVANSTYLASYCRKYNPHSYNVGQGCELDIFTNATGGAKPSDMVGIPGPVVGYVGVMQTNRLDIEILAHVAEHLPHMNIVLVGPEDEEFKASRLHAIKNIHFLGPKPPTELPAYINSFEVCLNPQLVNQTTIGNYPRKIDEYLAIGKPVVATATEAMTFFAEHTYLAKTKEDYVQLIQQALAEDNNTLHAQRSAFASSHTWENSVKEIYKAINAI